MKSFLEYRSVNSRPDPLLSLLFGKQEEQFPKEQYDKQKTNKLISRTENTSTLNLNTSVDHASSHRCRLS
jgi:tRNA(Leu) C34 or U34 (ribose-2'-O)-methylase TrmL